MHGRPSCSVCISLSIRPPIISCWRRSCSPYISSSQGKASLDERSSPLDITTLIGSAFTTVMLQESLRNKWLTAAGIMAIIKERYKFEGIYDFTLQELHKAINKLTVGCADIQNSINQTGIFRIKTKADGDKGTWFYYVTDPGGSLPHPMLRSDGQTPMEKTASQGTDLIELKDNPSQSEKTTTKEKGHQNEKKDEMRTFKEEWIKFHQDAQSACDEELERRESK